jgi:hypothetical protein
MNRHPSGGKGVSSKNTKIRKVVVLPDLQIPFHDKKSLQAVYRYLDDEAFDELIQLGDFMDFDCISHFNVDDLRLTENKRLFRDYEVGNEVLDELQKLVKKITILQGNHDFRIEAFIDKNPKLEGLIEMEAMLRFNERGINFVRYWENKTKNIYRIGHAIFIHGDYTTDTHAKKHALVYGTNVFYGHLHDVQEYSMVFKGDDKTIVGQSMGCLCRYDQQYMKGAPSRWQQAIGTFYFRPNGYFNHYVSRIFNHEFIAPNGKLYKA